ncbi:MAG: cyclic nucleotide-binding domain-containing protein [Candidatus Omnitrophica bacterium]|nr:cyclic nucleotide-binding domain-containing protein [Candidatus Omnitrophota bacterium]
MTTFDLPRPKDKLAILRKIPLFAACTEDQLQLVAERSRLVEYKKGEAVYHEGERAQAFYLVASGRLQVYTVANEQRQVYTVLHNGDTFGEISLLTGEVHSATVEAINDTLVLELDKPSFEDLLNRIPSLVLYLSRLLSKRLRTKAQAGGVGEATVVAMYSAAKGVGRTVFAVALAASLRRETGREAVVVDLSTPEGEVNRLFGATPHARTFPVTRRSLLAEEVVEHDTTAHPLGFRFLYAGELMTEAEGEALIAPLVSGLTKRFHYILLDLPVEVNAAVLKALTQADQIYLVSDCTRENVIRTSALQHQLREAVNYRDEQMKVILNLMDGGGERLSPRDVAQALAHPVNHVLPRIGPETGELTPEELVRLLESRESPYTRNVRRIARELGGVLVGLALGSGAALGLAHVGILKVLERERIQVDIIAGSSIGALIAGLWACGHTADDLEQMALRFKEPWDIRRLFVLDLSLPLLSVIIGAVAGVGMGLLTGFWAGLILGIFVCVLLAVIMGPLVGGPIQGSQLMATLQKDFEGKTFEDTWLPLKIIATNPMAREEIVFESGPIAEAVRASVSIPGIFKPVIRQGKICLDGGVINPVPVSALKQAGANRVIAVNVFPTTPELTQHLQEVQRHKTEWDAQLASKSFPVRLWMRLRQEFFRSVSPLVFDVIMRSMQSMEFQIAEVSCREADLILRPTVPGSHWLEFYNPEKFIRRGEEEAFRHLPILKRLTGIVDGSSAAAPSPTTPPALTTREDPGTILP